jgi:hypothetical protein
MGLIKNCTDVSGLKDVPLQEKYPSGEHISDEVRPLLIELINLQAAVTRKAHIPKPCLPSAAAYDFNFPNNPTP